MAGVSAPGGRRTALRAASLVVGGALLAVLLNRVSLAEVVATVRRADPLLVTLTLAAGMVVTALRALRFGFFFRPPAPFWPSLYGAFALFRLLKLTMPLHTGELALLALLKRRGLAPSIAETAPVWLLLRVADLVAVSLVLSGVLSLVAVPPELEVVRWVVLAGAVALIAVLFAPDRWLDLVAARFQATGWIGGRLAAARTGLRHARGRWRILGTLLTSIVLWLVMAATATLAQLAFASPLSLRECLAAAVVSQAASVLPIHAPLGLGTDDAIWTGMLVGFGLPLGEAIALALSVRMALIGTVVVDSAVGAVVLGIARPGGQR